MTTAINFNLTKNSDIVEQILASDKLNRTSLRMAATNCLTKIINEFTETEKWVVLSKKHNNVVIYSNLIEWSKGNVFDFAKLNEICLSDLQGEFFYGLYFDWLFSMESDRSYLSQWNEAYYTLKHVAKPTIFDFVQRLSIQYANTDNETEIGVSKAREYLQIIMETLQKC